MAGRQQSSLRRIFIVALVVGYALTALASTLVYLASARRLADSYLLQVAESRSLLDQNRIKALIGREVALCLKLADDPAIQSWLKDEGDPGLRDRAFEQLGSYQRLFRDSTVFIATAGLWQYHLSMPGSPFGTPAQLDPMNPADRWFFDTFARRESYWINVNYDRLLDEVRVWINTIVRDSKGTVLGVAGTGMELGGFLADLVQVDGERVQTLISNIDGQILAHPDRSITEYNARVQRDEDRIGMAELFADENSRNQLKLATSFLHVNRPGDFAMDAKPVLLRLRQPDGPVTVAVAIIPELNWFSYVVAKPSLFADNQGYLPFLVSPLVSLSILVLVVLSLLNRLVLHPVSVLTRAAQQLAAGDYSLTLEVPKQQETGLLARTFSEMAGQIREYTERLETMVEERTAELSKTQERIMESIRYGRLVQASIMPAAADLSSALTSHYTYVQSVDTVGGDFIFFQALENGFVAALADCTGHGVPGAIMSMLCASLLNRVVDTNPEAGPASMLAELHRLLRRNLKAAQETEHFENGMDVALCRYERPSDSLCFSSAGLPLFVLGAQSGSPMQKIEGSRLHLGFSRSGDQLIFREHLIPNASSQVFIIASDGIFDQPGGERGFGLGIQRFCAILEIARQHIPQTATAGQLGEQSLGMVQSWQGTWPQRDDRSLFSFTPRPNTVED